VLLVTLPGNSIEQSLADLQLLGRIFGRQAQVEQRVSAIQAQLDLVAQKVAQIPSSQRKRVVRLMGATPVTVPGDDSFQNQLIRAAGGVPPVLNQMGSVVEISQDTWQRFNPQVIYGCGSDAATLRQQLDHQPWNTVDAMDTGQLLSFPCELTCRAATHTGDFVAWLASRLYPKHFSRAESQIHTDAIFDSRSIALDLDYIHQARIDYSRIHDFVNKTLVVELKAPMTVLSTLEGLREDIRVVGNHFSPAPCWAVSHQKGLAASRETVYRVIGQTRKNSAFLFTGADMDRMSVQTSRFKAMAAHALVTAGVTSNAVSMSKDTGNYYEPGTINIVVLTNMKLSTRAMSRAVITATEAKTAALSDLDIRSSYGPDYLPATGTGTDNIIVVQGSGAPITLTGGHSKMGELIARAVYQGVTEAIFLQNGISSRRSIFQRLKERGITPYNLVNGVACDCIQNPHQLAAELEWLLLKPRYAGFVAAAMEIGDGEQRDLTGDLSAFNAWSKAIAEEIAGRSIVEPKPLARLPETMPTALQIALNALMNGIHYRDGDETP
jgi:adenosylcobinamide amidohydrolase